MVNLNRFYTYAYLREDRTPYYIGKGGGNRAYYKNKGEIRPPKNKSRTIFLKQNLTEEEAFKHEKYMIAVFGRKDLGTGILRNKTDGGEGSSGVVKSEETKRKMSDVNKGENNYWYGKRGEDNPHYGKSRSEETKRKISEAHKGRTHSEKSRRNMSEAHKGKYAGKNHPQYGKRGKETPAYGKKWWNDGCGNSKFVVECPGEGWVLGLSEETKRKMSEFRKCENLGKKWWNDGCGNSKFVVECPGEGWVPGMSKRKSKSLI
jgi:hypothetical protein